MKRLLRVSLAAIAILPALLAAGALAQKPKTDTRRVELRRTPAVEVFSKWKDSVVYLTGPMIRSTVPSTAEFFALPQKENVINLGSGFVVHPTGYILTNAHATEQVISLKVSLSDGRKLPAELITVVHHQDLALVKVKPPEPLAAVELAAAGDLMIGEPVIVIAHPHGLLHTCTAGTLSAVDRATNPSGLPGVTLRGLIQTDASVNAGSSGGPWFNVLGEAIGMTVSRKSDSENIAFGVPAATIRNMLPRMLDAERRYGITTGMVVSSLGPCKVVSMGKDSPAYRSGLHAGDQLVAIDGKPIQSGSDFHFGLVGHKPGEKLKIKFRRGERFYTATLTLANRNKPDGAALLREKYGLTAVPLDREKAKATALRVRRGVVITKVLGGLYDRLENPPLPGDVLARINYIRPRDLDHVGILLDRIPPGQPAEMVLLRLRNNIATRVDLTVTARE